MLLPSPSLFVGVVFNFQLHDDLLNRFRFILRIKSTRSIHLSATLQLSHPPLIESRCSATWNQTCYTAIVFFRHVRYWPYVDNDIVQVMTASCHCIGRSELAIDEDEFCRCGDNIEKKTPTNFKLLIFRSYLILLGAPSSVVFSQNMVKCCNAV